MALNQHVGYIFSLTWLLEHSFCSDQDWESIKTHHGNVLRISVLGSCSIFLYMASDLEYFC